MLTAEVRGESETFLLLYLWNIQVVEEGHGNCKCGEEVRGESKGCVQEG